MGQRALGRPGRPGRPGELLPLTGLRGVAAYSVLFAHGLSANGVTSPSLGALSYFGMSLFFVLSGFVIHYNYGSSFASTGIKEASKRFLLARFARLYPLYIVGLAASVSFPGMRFFKDIFSALSCITLTQTWFNVHGCTGHLIGFSWSISSEFFLYLLFIPFAATISRVSQPLRWLVGICLLAVGVVSLLAVFRDSVAAFLAPIQLRDPGISAPPFYWLIYFSPLIRAFEFFGGAMAAQLYLKTINEPSQHRNASIVVYACVGWCLLVILLVCRIDNPVIQTMMPNFIYAPAIITLLIFFCQFETLMLSKLMSSPLMVRAGDISYSVYLLQALVLIAVANTFAGSTVSSIVARLIYAVLITTALSYGVYHLFEMPARRWIRSLPKTDPSKIERTSY